MPKTSPQPDSNGRNRRQPPPPPPPPPPLRDARPRWAACTRVAAAAISPSSAAAASERGCFDGSSDAVSDFVSDTGLSGVLFAAHGGSRRWRRRRRWHRRPWRRRRRAHAVGRAVGSPTAAALCCVVRAAAFRAASSANEPSSLDIFFMASSRSPFTAASIRRRNSSGHTFASSEWVSLATTCFNVVLIEYGAWPMCSSARWVSFTVR